jgi:hypothetical protein
MAFREVVPLPTHDQLRDYIVRTLCEHNRWEPGQTHLELHPVHRGQRCCGAFYFLHGPHRRTKCHAVWAGDEARVLFYDSAGRRFAEVRLSDAPDPANLPTAPPGESRRAA